MKRVAVAYKDGRVLETYNIDFPNLDREPQDHWYFEKARENAIADKLVTESEANRISCRFVDDLGEEKASQSRSEAPNLEQGRIARIAKITAWVAAITVAIGAVIAVVSSLSAP